MFKLDSEYCAVKTYNKCHDVYSSFASAFTFKQIKKAQVLTTQIIN